MNKDTNQIKKRIWMMLLVFIVSSFFVLALPEGPSTFIVANTSRGETSSLVDLPVLGGNASAHNLDGITVTYSWQGIVGNVSGTLTLEDSANNVLYDWAVANPSGEIYASTSAVTWTLGNIMCYNFSWAAPATHTLSQLESSYGIDSGDADGINETFTEGTIYDEFYAATNLINDVCPEVQLFNSSSEKTDNLFQEVILWDNTSNKTIWTSILESSQAGFDSHEWDFEMIVPENGSDGNAAPTTYYFYIEIE